MSHIIYTWNFNTSHNRGSFWYIIALSIVIALVIWWFLTKQYGLSFILLLLTWISDFIENNSDDHVQVDITDIGIKIGEAFYDFSSISAYLFLYEWEHARILRLQLNKRGLRNIDLKVDNTIVSELKPILSSYLNEDPQEDFSNIDKLIKFLKL